MARCVSPIAAENQRLALEVNIKDGMIERLRGVIQATQALPLIDGDCVSPRERYINAGKLYDLLKEYNG